ncbi:MAG: branched-chain amino acid ABC transporter permease [Candidatus Heimdallarchaeota archaeon]
MNSEFAIQLLVSGILIGGIYGLSALGLSLIWGVMNVINAAHGHLIMLAAFMSYELFIRFGLNPLQSLLIVSLVGVALGALTYRVCIRRLLMQREFSHEMTLIMMFGVGIVIYGLSVYAWGRDIRGVPFLLPSLTVGFIIIPLARLLTFTIAILLTLILYFWLKKTYMGKAIRALAQSRDAAMVSGVNPDQLYFITFMIAFFYAFVAGIMVSIVSPGLTPYLGHYYIGRAFAIVVLGGLGNPIGAMVGGLILGVAESLATLSITYGFVPAIAFLLLILVLIFKPTGLFAPMR